MNQEDEDIFGADEARQVRSLVATLKLHELGQIRCATRGDGGVQACGESDVEKLPEDEESHQIFERGPDDDSFRFQHHACVDDGHISMHQSTETFSKTFTQFHVAVNPYLKVNSRLVSRDKISLHSLVISTLQTTSKTQLCVEQKKRSNERTASIGIWVMLPITWKCMLAFLASHST